jgi:6-phosphogluconolactonase (cycloisomerase 2 family)
MRPPFKSLINNLINSLAVVTAAALLGGCGGNGASSPAGSGGGGGGGGAGSGSGTQSARNPGPSALDPTGKYAYVVETQNRSIAQFGVNANGTLSALSPSTVAVGPGVGSIGSGTITTAHTATGDFAYVTDPTPGRIYQYRIGAGGALSSLNPAFVSTPNMWPIGIVPDPAGRYIYTVETHSTGGESRVNEYRISADGALTPANATADIGSQIVRIAISPDGQWIFTNNNSSATSTSSVKVVRVNADGTLTKMADSSLFDDAFWFAVSPDSKTLYVLGDQEIRAYRIDAGGALTPLGPPVATPSTDHFAMTPDGKFLYAPDEAAGGIAQYKVNADGSVTPLTPPTAPSAGPAQFVAISPDGKTLVASAKTKGAVYAYRINPDGALTAL